MTLRTFGECPWLVYSGAGGRIQGGRGKDKVRKRRRGKGESGAERGIKGRSGGDDGDDGCDAMAVLGYDILCIYVASPLNRVRWLSQLLLRRL